MLSANARRAALVAAGVVSAGAVVGLAASWLLHTAGLAASAWYCVTLAVTGLGLAVLARGMIGTIESPTRSPHGPTPRAEAPPDVLAPLERRLAAAVRERRLFVAGVRPLLHGLARERLRLHHSLDLDNALEQDPDLARRTMGDELWQWMTMEHDGPAPTAQQLQQMITTIEQL